MKRLALIALGATLLAGCLSAPISATHWNLTWQAPSQEIAFAKPVLNGSVRVSAITVDQPYAGDKIVVLRPDGSIAFDSFNIFATAPAVLLKAVVPEALKATKCCTEVRSMASLASADYQLDVVVSQLALDCRTADKYEAVAKIELQFVHDRKVVATGSGEGRVSKDAGTLGEVFSQAISAGLAEALHSIH